jgi:hypothetical protein
LAKNHFDLNFLFTCIFDIAATCKKVRSLIKPENGENAVMHYSVAVISASIYPTVKALWAYESDE